MASNLADPGRSSPTLVRQAIAALLHDAVEDQGGMAMESRIRTTFGGRVADIVMHCTDVNPGDKMTMESVG